VQFASGTNGIGGALSPQTRATSMKMLFLMILMASIQLAAQFGASRSAMRSTRKAKD
jgi:hypothetical protein